MGARTLRPAWLAPTRRAIDWTPLAVITGALLATATLLGWRQLEVPELLQYLAVAGLASAAVLGLADPARPLLQALPTTPITRLSHRGMLLVGATALAAGALLSAERLLDLTPTAAPQLAPALMALAALGTAVHTVAAPLTDHPHEAAAGSIMLCIVASALPLDFLPDTLRMAWLHHPWPFTAAATIVILTRITKPGA
ncbi:MAG: hypothetical protein ACKV2O_17880 [Acidimicrobiales bacterium]